MRTLIKRTINRTARENLLIDSPQKSNKLWFPGINLLQAKIRVHLGCSTCWKGDKAPDYLKSQWIRKIWQYAIAKCFDNMFLICWESSVNIMKFHGCDDLLQHSHSSLLEVNDFELSWVISYLSWSHSSSSSNYPNRMDSYSSFRLALECLELTFPISRVLVFRKYTTSFCRSFWLGETI